jgi:predicted HTH transcriptional regulator
VGDNEALILRMLSNQGDMSRSDLEKVVELSRSRLTDLLKNLLLENKIEKIGQSVRTKYRLKQ